MKETQIDKLTRQFKDAVKTIDVVRASYCPSNTRDILKISECIVFIYEIFKNEIIDKLIPRVDQGETLSHMRAYFLEMDIFEKDFCLVLMSTSNSDKHYGYSRLKVVKFLRGEAVHAGDMSGGDSSRQALKNFLYEENVHFKPAFAIRRNFLQFPNVIMPSECDSQSPFDEPIDVQGNKWHSLTTIESVVFSICNEIANMGATGDMNWNKSCVAYDIMRFRSLLRKPIAENIIEQSRKWNRWNRFPMVDDEQS